MDISTVDNKKKNKNKHWISNMWISIKFTSPCKRIFVEWFEIKLCISMFLNNAEQQIHTMVKILTLH